MSAAVHSIHTERHPDPRRAGLRPCELRKKYAAEARPSGCARTQTTNTRKSLASSPTTTRTPTSSRASPAPRCTKRSMW